MSLINYLLEMRRQFRTGDTAFYRKYLFFFELEVPRRLVLGVTNRFVYPLVINPENYHLSEPFSVEVSNTADAGVWVEENGIITRTIRLEGHTGFRPRDLRGRQPLALLTQIPNGRSYTRALPPALLAEVSGHRHFMYLQDAVFRTYADLKRDPATADETFLYFHNPKDEEHWLVVPQKFDLQRTKDRRTLYPYSIELLAVDKAEDAYVDFSEDLNLLERMKNLIRMIKDGVAMVSGAINDITALVAEIKQFIKNIVGIIDTVKGIIDAANNFLNGVTDLIQVPFAAVESVIGIVSTSMETVFTAEEIGYTARSFPQNVAQRMLSLQDGLELLATHPEAYETRLQARVRELREKQNEITNTSAEEISAALETDPPGTFEEADNQGTGLTQGEALAAQGADPIQSEIKAFTGAVQVTVGQGDTLVNLAARYLGDARLWQHLAIMNGLKPPFTLEDADAPIGTEDSGLSQTLTRGKKLLVPTYDAPPDRLPLLPVLGVKSDATAEEQILGTDFKMVAVGGRPGSEMFDFEVDAEAGSNDFRVVRGVDCLAQGLRTRAVTEEGTDILYKRMGMKRVVGMGIEVLDDETFRFRGIEAINQDARVSAVRRLEIEVDQDKVSIDADVEIRGFTQAQPVHTEI